MRLREVKRLAQDHKAHKQKNRDLNSENPTLTFGAHCTVQMGVCICVRVVKVGVFLELYFPRPGHKGSGSGSAGIIVQVPSMGQTC